ncbi:MAG: FtsW/RodA/SpoVE family cell cycle protein, partial [Burkholderiales bacterium]
MFYRDVQRIQPAAEYDRGIVGVTVALLSLGIVMVYSSSIAMAEAARHTGHQSAYFLLRHTLFVAVSVAIAIAAFQVPIRIWQRYAPLLFLSGMSLLVLVLVPGIGREVNGSQRWLPLGLLNLQPSEVMKFFVVLYAADYT